MIDNFDLVMIFNLFDDLCVDCYVVNVFDIIVSDWLVISDDC